MTRNLALLFAFLLSAACAGDRMSAVLTETYDGQSPSAGSIEQTPIESKTADNPSLSAEGRGPATKPPKASVQAQEKGGGEERESRKTTSRVERRKGEEKGPVVGRDTAAAVAEMSLLIRKDDIEEEELSSLLTSDYFHQFDIPVVFNDAVQYFVRYFSTQKRRVLVNWLQRSRRYAPMIKSVLRDQGLPEDLLYLAMIESGFNPKAYSSMKACGPWQFIYETGGRYGLKVNHWVDERRDPEKSTVAAALYLKDLFNQFGSWYLAAAGYNAGEKRIEKAVEKHETTDFWEISKYNTLPRETRDYIPRLLAAAIIAKDPEKFGFTNIAYDEPIRVLTEKVPAGVPLATVARAATIDLSTIRRLNPEILTGITPPDAHEYAIKLPEGVRRETFRQDLQSVIEKEKRLQGVTAYAFKKKESLSAVMKRFKVAQNDIALVNSCDEPVTAKPGRVIYIPEFRKGKGTEGPEPVLLAQPLSKETTTGLKQMVKADRKPEKERPLASDSGKGRVRAKYHLVKKGENLAAISEKYGIDADTLREINGIKKGVIHPNMRLRLTGHAKSSKDEKLGETAVFHVVKKGETLTAIADRYDITTKRLSELNRLKKGRIRWGMRLKVSDGEGKG